MSNIDDTLINRFLRAARGRKEAKWVRFFVPLEGTAIALEFYLERSNQISRLRVSDRQTETLNEKPRLKSMLVDAAQNRLDQVNLLLEELDMPWEVISTFRYRHCAIGAIIEAAHNRLLDLARENETNNDDCA